MAVRIIIGLITLLAIVEGLAPDALGSGIVALLLVILGLVYGAMAIDAEDATAYLVVTLAVGGAAATDVLSHIHAVGAHLDAILDQASVALYAGVVSILVVRVLNRLKG